MSDNPNNKSLLAKVKGWLLGSSQPATTVVSKPANKRKKKKETEEGARRRNGQKETVDLVTSSSHDEEDESESSSPDEEEYSEKSSTTSDEKSDGPGLTNGNAIFSERLKQTTARAAASAQTTSTIPMTPIPHSTTGGFLANGSSSRDADDPVTLALLKFKGRLISSMEKHELEDHLTSLGLSNRGTKAELLQRLSGAVLALRDQKSILVDDMSAVRTPLMNMTGGLPKDKYERLRRLLASRVDRDDSAVDTTFMPRSTGPATRSAPYSAHRAPYSAVSSYSHAPNPSLKRTPGDAFSRVSAALNSSTLTEERSAVKRPRVVEFANDVQNYSVDDLMRSSSTASGAGNQQPMRTHAPSSALKRPRDSLHPVQSTTQGESADEVARRILSTLGRLATPVEPLPSGKLDKKENKSSSNGVTSSEPAKPLAEETRPAKKTRVVVEEPQEEKTPEPPMRHAKKDETSPVPSKSISPSAVQSSVTPKFAFSPAPPAPKSASKPKPSPEEIAKFSFERGGNTWECKHCGVDNDESRQSCSYCFAEKVAPSQSKATFSATESLPASSAKSVVTKAPVAQAPIAARAPVSQPPANVDDIFAKFQMKPNQWKCPVCLIVNEESSSKCRSCENDRPAKAGQTAASSTAPAAAQTPGNKRVTFAAENEKFVISGDKVLPMAEKEEPKPAAPFFSFAGNKNESAANAPPVFNLGGKPSGTAPVMFGGAGAGTSATPSSMFTAGPTSASVKATEQPKLFGSNAAVGEKSDSVSSTQPASVASSTPFVFNTGGSIAPVIAAPTEQKAGAASATAKTEASGSLFSFGGTPATSEPAKAPAAPLVFGAGVPKVESVTSTSGPASTAFTFGGSSTETKPTSATSKDAPAVASTSTPFAFGAAGASSSGNVPFTFGGTSTSGSSIFGAGNASSAPLNPPPALSSGIFGGGGPPEVGNGGGLVRTASNASGSSQPIFGSTATLAAPAPSTTPSGFGGGQQNMSLFGGGQPPVPSNGGGSLFGATQPPASGTPAPGIFGGGNPPATTSFGGNNSLFGGGNAQQPPTTGGGSLFGGAAPGGAPSFGFGANNNNIAAPQPQQSSNFMFGGGGPGTGMVRTHSTTPPPGFFGGGAPGGGAPGGGGMFGAGAPGGFGGAPPGGGFSAGSGAFSMGSSGGPPTVKRRAKRSLGGH